MPSNHLILCCPLLLPSIFPSIRVFSNESVLRTRWPKYWRFSFSISPSNEYSGLISLGLMIWSPCCPRDSQEVFSSTTAWKYQFLSAQPSSWSHSHILTWLLEKNHSISRKTFLGKVMSLFFNTLSRFVIALIPRSKRLLISWLQSPTEVILEPKKIKSVTVSIVYPSTCHEVTGLDAIIFVFWTLNSKPAFSLSSFTFIKRLFSSSLLSVTRVVSSVYLKLLIFLLAILMLDCDSSSLAFHTDVLCREVKYSGWQYTALMHYFPNFKPVHCSMSGSVISWPAHRFLRRQVQCFHLVFPSL